jgi:hypothetical protein
MVIEDDWSRVRDLDGLLAKGRDFPQVLWQPQSDRMELEPALWRAPSHGLDLPDAAKLLDVADYAPAHHHIVRFREAAVFPQSGLVMPEFVTGYATPWRLAGEDYLCADAPVPTANEIVRLLQDFPLARTLADNAGAVLRERYSRAVVESQLDQVLAMVHARVPSAQRTTGRSPFLA